MGVCGVLAVESERPSAKNPAMAAMMIAMAPPMRSVVMSARVAPVVYARPVRNQKTPTARPFLVYVPAMLHAPIANADILARMDH